MVAFIVIREGVKYYFADFVRKGGGVPPKSVTPFLPKILSVKGGRGVPPISVTYFLDQKEVFFGQKTPFLALLKNIFRGKNSQFYLFPEHLLSSSSTKALIPHEYIFLYCSDKQSASARRLQYKRPSAGNLL